MQYDPIKRSLGSVFNSTPFLRKIFYRLLDLLLLRSWHVRREVKKWAATAPKDASILDAGSGFGQYQKPGPLHPGNRFFYRRFA